MKRVGFPVAPAKVEAAVVLRSDAGQGRQRPPPSRGRRGKDIGARALAAARAMVGARFRPQGNDPATGLDCVGLVWAAYAAAGRRLVRPLGYPLRGWARVQVEAGLVDAGFAPVGGAPRDGDVALIAYPAGQFHLVILGRASFVHAHAGLRCVVETPLDGVVRGIACWRLEQCPPRCD